MDSGEDLDPSPIKCSPTGDSCYSPAKISSPVPAVVAGAAENSGSLREDGASPPPTTISDHRDNRGSRGLGQIIRRVGGHLGGGRGSNGVHKKSKRKKEKNAARKERKATKTLAIVLGKSS